MALQALDTAAERARRRLEELPVAQREFDEGVAAAEAVVAAINERRAGNQAARRELETQLAAVETRLARFDEHKASVKTNQEYTALLHEISTFKAEKDRIEEQILLSMEAADGLAAELAAAERELAAAKSAAESGRAALAAEARELETEIARLQAEKDRESRDIDRGVLTRYEQLLKQRRMVAVAVMRGEVCEACHVRLRPAVAQQVRRNTDIVQCDSCQRILYFVPPSDEPAAASP